MLLFGIISVIRGNIFFLFTNLIHTITRHQLKVNCFLVVDQPSKCFPRKFLRPPLNDKMIPLFFQQQFLWISTENLIFWLARFQQLEGFRMIDRLCLCH